MMRQIFAVLSKELLVEWRQRSRVVGVLAFGLLLLFLFAFAGGSKTLIREFAGGAIWVGMLLAAVRSLDQAFHLETENGSLEGLVLWPVSPTAIFFGKALATAILLLVVGTLLTPFLIALYDVNFHGSWAMYFGILAAGSFAIAAPGTLLGMLSVQARGSSVLLPLLLFPLLMPVMLAAARATTVVIEGDPMGQGDDWLQWLLVINAIHWILDSLLFHVVVEDT